MEIHRIASPASTIPGLVYLPQPLRRAFFDLNPQVMVEARRPYSTDRLVSNISDSTLWVPVPQRGRGAEIVNQWEVNFNTIRFGFGINNEEFNGAFQHENNKIAIFNSFNILGIIRPLLPSIIPNSGGALIGTMAPLSQFTGLVINKMTGYLEFWVGGVIVIQHNFDYRNNDYHRVIACLDIVNKKASIFHQNTLVVQATGVNATNPTNTDGNFKVFLGAGGIEGGVPQNRLIADVQCVSVISNCALNDPTLAVLLETSFSYLNAVATLLPPDVAATEMTATIF